MNPKVDFYFENAEKWQAELQELRKIALDCQLTEELKWGTACYTLHNSNIVLIHSFKEYFAFLFFKGALLKDTDQILVHQSENVQAARQIRFTSLEEIVTQKSILKTYIYQAIEVEKAGLKVKLKKTDEFKMAEEFQEKLDENKALEIAFKALSPGRQRAYLLYFSAPKNSTTRASRVEKVIDQILEGKGLKD
ncbi:YdeI/OmpD-associated family protein [Flavobacterium sp. T12S277]|uniref:YdeI/OmpD-associated family protein n=1 Tax=Flavobacterium sp. T12S277 TaxID=3402752 RepID=UPI003AE58136